MDPHKHRNCNPTSPPLRLPNGYILPEGKLTPNALFVGGIDLKVDENEMRDFFARYGTVKEVKIISYRGGICKGYGFVYFDGDVNVQSIIEQPISFKGRKLKLGPAIMKERNSRSMSNRMVYPVPWTNHTQYFYCAYCSSVGGGPPQPAPVFNGANPYHSPYTYNNVGFVMPQMPQVNYGSNPYAYQAVDCGLQAMMTVL